MLSDRSDSENDDEQFSMIKSVFERSFETGQSKKRKRPGPLFSGSQPSKRRFEPAPVRNAMPRQAPQGGAAVPVGTPVLYPQLDRVSPKVLRNPEQQA